MNEGTDPPDKPKRNPDKSEIERIKAIKKREEDKLTKGYDQMLISDNNKTWRAVSKRWEKL